MSGYVDISHVVVSNSGCSDTVNFSVKILGSNPFFTMSDSIGCDPMSIVFTNKSTNSSSYIWEFGDNKNITRSTNSKDPVTFKYTQEGEYHIKLIGIDTIYNQYTGNVYYCKSIFPGYGQYKNLERKVKVLPSFKTGIVAIDTICLGQEVLFKSNSSKRFDEDIWDFGDGNIVKKSPGASFIHKYKNAGNYTVLLKPIAPIIADEPYCHNKSATKLVTVIGVKAYFSINPKSSAPIFYMKNESTPMNADFNWDFNHARSATNLSTEVHPSHQYGKEGRSSHLICLTATAAKQSYPIILKVLNCTMFLHLVEVMHSTLNMMYQ